MIRNALVTLFRKDVKTFEVTEDLRYHSVEILIQKVQLPGVTCNENYPNPKLKPNYHTKLFKSVIKLENS